MNIKYPDIHVQLTGKDGNAFAIMGAVASALRSNGIDQDEIDVYQREATSGDYDNLLITTMNWVNVS